MKPVVIRCSNCGATQDALGACETCHEADVGYFCANHAPSRWIDGPACEACGAFAGMPEVEPAPGPPPVRPTVERPPRRSGITIPSSRTRGPRDRWEPPGAPGADPPLGAPPTLEDVLAMLGAAGARAPGTRGARPRRESPWSTGESSAAARGAARGAIGCVARLVTTALIVIALVVVLGLAFMGGLFGSEVAADQSRQRAGWTAPAGCAHPSCQLNESSQSPSSPRDSPP